MPIPTMSESRQVGKRTLFCRHIIKQGTITHNRSDPGYAVLRCLAEADESGLCPVHRHEIALDPRRPRLKRDLDADLLPWTEQDEAIFSSQPTKKK